MISEQINNLRAMVKSYKPYVPSAIYSTLTKALDTIESLSAKLQEENMERSAVDCGGGWIPCKDRLPEEDGFYLVTLTDRITDIADMRIMKIYFSKTSNSFVGYGDTVVAWQPLPEPYHEP